MTDRDNTNNTNNWPSSEEQRRKDEQLARLAQALAQALAGPPIGFTTYHQQFGESLRKEKLN